MPGVHTPLPGPLFYWRDILVSTLVTGFFLWLLINVRRRFPPFAGVLFAVCCLTGSAIPISLLQLLFSPLNSLFGTLTPLLMFATGGLVGTIRLSRAKYREETQSLGFLLFAVIVALLVILLVQLLPLVGYRDVFAFSTAGALTAAIAIIPYWYLRRDVVSRLTRSLTPPPLPVSSQSFGRVKRLTLTCTLLGFVGLVVLWRTHHLGLLIPSLPGVSAFFAWFLIMDAFTCWVTIARPRPSYGAAQETATFDGEG